MQIKLLFSMVLFSFFGQSALAQSVIIEGRAADSSHGFNVIEIVINDTLSKVMQDPKLGRPKYLKMYQNPRFVVRTDSSGRFRIKAMQSDTLFFKSYQHTTKAIPVRDLINQKEANIILVRATE